LETEKETHGEVGGRIEVFELIWNFDRKIIDSQRQQRAWNRRGGGS